MKPKVEPKTLTIKSDGSVDGLHTDNLKNTTAYIEDRATVTATQKAQFENEGSNSGTIKGKAGGTTKISYSAPAEDAKGLELNKLPKTMRDLDKVIEGAKKEVKNIIEDIKTSIEGK